jgi:hypothetical protein
MSMDNEERETVRTACKVLSDLTSKEKKAFRAMRKLKSRLWTVVKINCDTCEYYLANEVQSENE